MKRKEIFLIVILIAFGILYHFYKSSEDEIFLSCSNGSKNLLDSEYHQDFIGEKAVFESIKSLSIENPAGSIFVGRSESIQLEVVAIKRVYHRNRGRAIEIQDKLDIHSTQNDERLKFMVNSAGKFPYRRVRIIFKVWIPKGIELQLVNRYGDVDVNFADGIVAITNKYGNILAKDITAGMNLFHGYGQVILQGIAGPVTMESKYSNIKISDAQELNINGRHTRMQLFGIKQGVQLSNSHDLIELRDIKGDVRLEARHCRIKLLNLDVGHLEVMNSYDSVDIENLWAREAEISLSHGNLDLRYFEVEKRIDIRNRHSDIILEFSPNLKPSFDINLIYGKVINDTSLPMTGRENKYKQEYSIQQNTPHIFITNHYGNLKLLNVGIEKTNQD